MFQNLNVETQVQLDKFKPRDYQLPLLDALENKGYKRAIAVWPRRCLSGESHILMANGSFMLLKDIQVGDEIASWDGEAIVSDKVKNIWKTEAKKTIKIKSIGYKPLITSEDHLFAVTGLMAGKLTPILWKKASEIRKNHCLLNVFDKRCRVIGDWNGCNKVFVSKLDGPIEELYDLETEIHHNFIANGYVVHNSGKDLVGFNYLIRCALRKVGVYYIIYPTYAQGKKILWDSMTNDGVRFLDYIPPELIESTNSTEMKIRLINQSLIQVVGSDDPSRLVGTNAIGMIFSEYALQDPRAYQFMRPVLTANDGWALFLSTPRGYNNLWELYNIALANPDYWFCSKLTVNETGHIDLADIQREKDSGEMSEDLIQQEYFTSFSLGIEGSYYTKYVDKARLDARIGIVPYESGLKTNSVWDLGVRDSTSIIIFQVAGQTVRIIDCYENSKVGLEHYIKVLEQKAHTQSWIWGKHFAPHDIAVKEWGTGMTRIEKAKQLGINFTITPNIPVEDGIEAVRSAFNKFWFDEQKCKPLIKALENYRQEWDEKKKVYKANPLHNWASNFSDSFRYLCVNLPRLREGLTPEELDKRHREALYGDNSNIPAAFRDPREYY